jgi:hypothetical protein
MSDEKKKEWRDIIKEDRSGVRIAGHDERSGAKKVSSQNKEKDK